MLERSYVSTRAAKPDNAENFYASIVKSLSTKMTEETRQESVRIIRDCSRPRDNLTALRVRCSGLYRQIMTHHPPSR